MGSFEGLDFKADDVLKASDLNAIVGKIRQMLGGSGGGDGVEGVNDRRGNRKTTSSRRVAWVGKANGAISAASGSTWGTGSVTRYYLGASNAEVSTGASYTVLNPSSNTMTGGAGIASGSRCFVQEDDAGNLIVSPLECS